MDTLQAKPMDGAGEIGSATDEELFCDYLAARVQQALETLNAVRDELTAKPQDTNIAMQVLRRVYELRDLRKQLDNQRSRVNLARQAEGLEAVTPAEEPAIASNAPEAFRAAQAEQAAKIMEALKSRPRTCPSCQAPILGNDAQCQCGHTLANELGAVADAAATHALRGTGS